MYCEVTIVQITTMGGAYTNSKLLLPLLHLHHNCSEKEKNTKISCLVLIIKYYRVGHKKVAHHSFYTFPCDIFSGVSMYIA